MATLVSPTLLELRPARRVRRSVILTAIAMSTPLFLIFYGFALGRGTWLPVLALHLLFVGIAWLAIRRISVVVIRVTPLTVETRGYLGAARETPLDSLRRIVIAEVFPKHSPDTTMQLVALGPDGRCRLRVRGQFWDASALAALAAASKLDTFIDPSPVSEAEFFAAYPGSWFWFENNPIATVAIALVGIGIVTLIVSVMLAVVGVGTLVG